MQMGIGFGVNSDFLDFLGHIWDGGFLGGFVLASIALGGEPEGDQEED